MFELTKKLSSYKVIIMEVIVSTPWEEALQYLISQHCEGPHPTPTPMILYDYVVLAADTDTIIHYFKKITHKLYFYPNDYKYFGC